MADQTHLVASRAVAREAAFQALYAIKVGRLKIDDALSAVRARTQFAPATSDFLERIVRGVVAQYLDLDVIIGKALSKGWSVERLAVCDLVALRIAAYELWHEPAMPPKVTISQGVQLAKKFGSADSGPFVNGVLATLLTRSPKVEWQPGDEHLTSEEIEPSPSTTEAPIEDVEETDADDVSSESEPASPWTLTVDP